MKIILITGILVIVLLVVTIILAIHGMNLKHDLEKQTLARQIAEETNAQALDTKRAAEVELAKAKKEKEEAEKTIQEAQEAKENAEKKIKEVQDKAVQDIDAACVKSRIYRDVVTTGTDLGGAWVDLGGGGRGPYKCAAGSWIYSGDQQLLNCQNACPFK